MQINPLCDGSDVCEHPSIVEYKNMCDRALVLEAVMLTGCSGTSVITPFATAHYILAIVGSISVCGRASCMLDLISVVASRLHDLYKEGFLLRGVSGEDGVWYKLSGHDG